jgi:uncharacterized protein (DUF1330 family)
MGRAMTVTTLSLLDINENEPAALGDYLRLVDPMLERAGARIVKRFRITEVFASRRPSLTAVFIEYPDLAAVDLVLKSHEYEKAAPVRKRAFRRFSVSIGLGSDRPMAAAEQTA